MEPAHEMPSGRTAAGREHISHAAGDGFAVEFSLEAFDRDFFAAERHFAAQTQGAEIGALREWARDRNVGLPVVPEDCEQSYHMFYLLLRSRSQRDALIAHLKAHGILAVFHYLPLHLSEMGRKLGGRPGDCPVAEDVADRLLRLPFYNDLTEQDQALVVSAIREFDGTS